MALLPNIWEKIILINIWGSITQQKKFSHPTRRKISHLIKKKERKKRQGDHPRKNADFFFFFIENTVADFHELW